MRAPLRNKLVAVDDASRYAVVDSTLPSLMIPLSLPIEYVIGFPAEFVKTSVSYTHLTLPTTPYV